MATAKSAWGIDIGQCGLKALKLREVEGALEVEAFDVVEHEKILSEPDADRHDLIRTALERFLERNDVSGASVTISVPGQTSFTRFVKLPPVEPKRVPDIVRFEAEQQIPFPIHEVIWRYQTFQAEDAPDVEVGIFAMKRTDVAETLDHFAEVGLQVDQVQMAPLALYNFLEVDGQTAEKGATLLVDIGANNTDLVVADGSRIWTRTIQIGGNNFTDALVKAFKLSFAKAEKLKRTAASSKYARQIFQAMRPVFADLVQETQRSIGYYTSLHRESRFARLVGLGNGFRLPGLQKFLQKNLGLDVVRVDAFRDLRPSGQVNAAAFNENVLSFAVAYGLGAQGLGLAPIRTSLLPEDIARKRIWDRKRPWFAAAAALLAATAACPLYRSMRDGAALAAHRPQLAQAQADVERVKEWQSQYNRYRNQGQEEQKKVAEYRKLFGYRQHMIHLHESVVRSLRDTTMGPMLPEEVQALQALAAADPQGQADLVARLRTEQAQAAALEYVRDAAVRDRLIAGLTRPMAIQTALNYAQGQPTAPPAGTPAASAATPGAEAANEPAGPPSEWDRLLDKLKARPRDQRRVLVLESIAPETVANVDEAAVDPEKTRQEKRARPEAPAGGRYDQEPIPPDEMMRGMGGRDGDTRGRGRRSDRTRGRASRSREPEKPKGKMGLRVRVVGHTPLGKIQAGDVLSQLETALRAAAEDVPSLTVLKDKTLWRFLEQPAAQRGPQRDLAPGGREAVRWLEAEAEPGLPREGRAGAEARTDDVPRDPLTGEDVSNDVRWELIFLVRIDDDGVPDTGDEAPQQAEAPSRRGRRSGA